MASSRERVQGRTTAFAACVVLFGTACAAGNGQGSVTGIVSAPDCGLHGDPFDLHPNFFAADPNETDDFIEIRVQRGSNYVDVSDAVTIFVAQASVVKTMELGVPLAIGEDLTSPVRMSFSLNHTCPFSWNRYPVNYVAVSGSITFTALYVRSVDKNDLDITATFTDVQFIDNADPANRYATLSGDFHFLFNRGRPAQPFP